MKSNETLELKDITDIKGIKMQPSSVDGLKIYTFECKVRGIPSILTYETVKHNEGDGFALYTENDDFWDTMDSHDLSDLEFILSQKAYFYDWQRNVENAKDIEELQELKYAVMDVDDDLISPETIIIIYDEIYSKERSLFDAQMEKQFSGKYYSYVPSHKKKTYETRYFEPEYDINGTADELFLQASNGYIRDPEILHRIFEILEQEEKTDDAEIVRYMEEREREDSTLYTVGQMKIDFIYGQYEGIDDVCIREGLYLTVVYEQNNDAVIVQLAEYDDPALFIGTASMTLDEFKAMSRSDFDHFVNEVYAYNMIEQEEVTKHRQIADR